MAILTPLLFLALISTAFAWSALPHMLVYAIARKDITDSTWAKMQKYFSYLPENDLNYKSWYEMACWADDIKGADLGSLDGWHFANIPFYDGISPEEAYVIYNKDFNVIHTLNSSHQIFLKSDNDQMFYKSFMLRFYIHFMGDMHQPLHVCTRATKAHPDGDHGGNLFKLDYHIKNLHALWDEMMGMMPSIKRPLDQTSISTIENWAGTIISTYPRAKLEQELKIKDYETMAKRVHEIAEKEAYVGIRENSKPDDQYLRLRFETCKRLVALAGYRLADFLNTLMK